jgi:CheY-like chemotaxis protein
VAPKTILIVDDDLAFAQFLDELLTAAGYRIVVAKHGAAAFLELEIASPDLMIVDVFMPVIDGITFCRMARLNRATRTTPIIVMSATPNLHQTIPVPISGLLTKPLDIDALLHLVATLIEEPATERQVGE